MRYSYAAAQQRHAPDALPRTLSCNLNGGAGDARRYASSYQVPMSVRVEADEWVSDGRKILSAENIAAVRAALEGEGPVIVEHWFCRGGGLPRGSSLTTSTPLSSTFRAMPARAMPSTSGVSPSCAGMRMC
jgi:hypothetical protein